MWRKEARFAGMACHTGKGHQRWEGPRPFQRGGDEGATTKPSEKSTVLFQQHDLYLSSFYPCMDHIYPSALHENHDVAFKYCPNQKRAGKMKEGKAGQPSIQSQNPHAPKFCLWHKGRVNLRINGAGTMMGGCLQFGRCSKLPLHLHFWQLSDSFYFTNNHGWLPVFELWSGGVLRFSKSLVFSGVQLKHVMWSEMCFPCFKRSSRRKLGGASGPFSPPLHWMTWKMKKNLFLCECIPLDYFWNTLFRAVQRTDFFFFFNLAAKPEKSGKKFISDWLICFVWL